MFDSSSLDFNLDDETENLEEIKNTNFQSSLNNIDLDIDDLNNQQDTSEQSTSDNDLSKSIGSDLEDLFSDDDFSSNLSNTSNDDLGLEDLFGDLYADQKDDTIKKEIPFKGFYLDFLGFNPNIILKCPVDEIITLMKIFYDRKKLDLLAKNMNGYDFNNLHYQGFISYMREKASVLPDHLMKYETQIYDIVEEFTSKWEKINEYIKSSNVNTIKFALSRELSTLLLTSEKRTSLITGLKRRDVFKELINNPNSEFMDFIIKKIKLLKDILELGEYEDYKELIETYTFLTLEYSSEEKEILEYLGFITIFGQEHYLVRIDDSKQGFQQVSNEINDFKNMTVNTPSAISRFINLYYMDINKSDNESLFISF